MSLAKSIAVAVVAAGLAGAVAAMTTLRLTSKQTNEVTSAQLAAVQAELDTVKEQAAKQNVVLGHVARVGTVAPHVEARPILPATPPPPHETKKAPEATVEVLTTHFGDAFASQAVDPAWSKGAEGTVVRDVNRRLPEGSSIESVECRQSMCQLRSSHASMDTYQKFADDALFSRERGLWNGAITTLVVESGAAGVKSVSYIAREGHDLPSLEATN